MTSRLSPEDQQKVDQYLSAPQHQVERQPFRVWRLLTIVLIAVIGRVVFGQKLDLAAVLGMGMILAGIVVIHLFSRATPH